MGKIAPGKYLEAIQWATELAEYYKKYEGIPSTELWTTLFGDEGLLIITSVYKDLVAFQKIYDQAVNDQQYIGKMLEASNYFIGGFGSVTLWRSLLD
jgi:hypothetical protein